MMKGFLAVLAAVSLAGCFVSDDDGGRLRVSWSITIDGAAATCAEVGAASVEVISTRAGTSDLYSDTFTCSAFGGTTGRMRAGRYTVVVKLLDASDRPFDQPTVVFETDVFSGETTQGGTAVFPFVFPEASFRVQMGNGTTSNCGASNPGGGAGVAVQEIRVFDAGGNSCLRYEIDGVTNASNQPVLESTCELFLCQESNTVHFLTGLPNGTYDIQVLGYKGATGGAPYPCYSAERRFTISGNDVDLGTIVAPFTSSLDARCDATKPEAAAGG
jgi:hypothetical protein